LEQPDDDSGSLDAECASPMTSPTAFDEQTQAPPVAAPTQAPIDRPVVIEVRRINKTFQIPENKVDTLRERVTQPFNKGSYRTLQALRDVSFDVHQGEFFGIVGRNGSGKSTLLKIMSSIYRPDSGTVRMAGRLAPFIELGVGFNPELTSRENVVLNGVLMGLTRREAQRRLDQVLDFAGLREFADLKLKNYSSGMTVRLAFAVMVEADADIMLVDEVLAVGDAEFAARCMDVFREKRRAGKTLVLVTHDMATVQAFCDRAMLIHDAEVQYLGDPEETALRYFRLNFNTDDVKHVAEAGAVPDVNAKVIDVWLEDDDGNRIENVEQGKPIHFNLIIEARRDLHHPVFGFHVLNPDGVHIFGFNSTLDRADDEPDEIPAGKRVKVSATIENRLLPARYSVTAFITRNRAQGDIALHLLRLLDFQVYGTQPGAGSVSVDVDASATFVDNGGAA
jgi:ABC-2 type transport system ATP-binding protein